MPVPPPGFEPGSQGTKSPRVTYTPGRITPLYYTDKNNFLKPHLRTGISVLFLPLFPDTSPEEENLHEKNKNAMIEG